MAKNRNQNRSSNKTNKSGKNNVNVKEQNTSRNNVKPDDVPRRDGPGGN